MAVIRQDSSGGKFSILLTFLMIVSILIVASTLSLTGWALDTSVAVPKKQNSLRKVRTVENEDLLNSLTREGLKFIESLDGVAFPPEVNTLLLFDEPPSREATVVVLFPNGTPGAELPIADPINLAVDSQNTDSSLFLFEGTTHELVVIRAFDSPELAPATITRFGMAHLGVQDPVGMTIDSVGGRLFLLDASNSQIVHLNVGPSPNFDVLGGQISVVALPPDLRAPRGLAFNPATGHLFVFSQHSHMLWELTETGKIVATHNLSGVSPGAAPQGLVFAPSLDRTDDPSVVHLFMISREGKKKEVWELAISPSL